MFDKTIQKKDKTMTKRTKKPAKQSALQVTTTETTKPVAGTPVPPHVRAALDAAKAAREAGKTGDEVRQIASKASEAVKAADKPVLEIHFPAPAVVKETKPAKKTRAPKTGKPAAPKVKKAKAPKAPKAPVPAKPKREKYKAKGVRAVLVNLDLDVAEKFYAAAKAAGKNPTKQARELILAWLAKQ